MNIRSRWRLVCLVLLLFAAACGRRTNPLVPESPRPEAIGNIKAVTRDAAAYLSWPLPTRNIEGKKMDPSSIRQIRIYRADFGRERKKARYRQYTEINMAAPAPAVVRNNMVYWSDSNLKYDQTYGYRIRALSARGGISMPSEEVLVRPVMPLAMPQGLVALGLDSSVMLTWEPVTKRLDGSPSEGVIVYNVYRGSEKGFHDDKPVNAEPLKGLTYKDSGLVNGQTYYYVVRSVDTLAPPWNESPDSAEASVTPQDLTPPGRPTGLTVVAGADRVFLTWNENRESDLAGYYIYRSVRNGKDFERITDTLITKTTFSDDSVKSGVTYYYIVTAVDKSGNESKPSEERKVHFEKLK